MEDEDEYEIADGDVKPEGELPYEGIPETMQLKATYTSNPARPRTLRAGYDPKNQTMTVVFRDGTWWNYYDVPEDVWSEFKAAKSKGEYLWNNGFDNRNGGIYAYGATDMSLLSRHQKVMLAQTVEISRKLQKALKGGQSTKLYGRWVDYRLRGQGGFKPYE